MKKTVEPHMWVLSRDTTGAFLVTIGHPYDAASVIKRRFSGLDKEQLLRDWVKDEMLMQVSVNMVVDLTGLGLVPDTLVKYC